MSIITNIVASVKGDIEPEQAVVNVVKDTASSAAVGYGTGYATSVVSIAMNGAKSGYVKTLSKTSLPAAIVTATIGTTTVMTRYFKGELTGLECFEQLGEQGVGMISSALFSTLGGLAIPVVGNIVGSMVGYAIASASYGTLLNSIKEAKASYEERVRVERECEEYIKLIREYRMEMEEHIKKYLMDNEAVFHKSFDDMKQWLLR